MTEPILTRAEEEVAIRTGEWTTHFTPIVRQSMKRFVKSPVPQALYLLRHPWEQWVKVGIAISIPRRMESYIHAWGCLPPIPPIVVSAEMCMAMGIRAHVLEQFIKVRFEEYRLINREWLKLTPPVVELVTVARDNPRDLARLLNIQRR